MKDPIRLLAALPQAEPDRVRAGRIRARCHAVLGGAGARRPATPRRLVRAWEPLLTGLGVLYLAESARLALQLLGPR